MGSLFKPKYRDRHGVIKESAVWWIQRWTTSELEASKNRRSSLSWPREGCPCRTP